MGSSSSSGEFLSNEDSAHRDGDYWKAGVKLPGLLFWISRRRKPDSKAASEVCGANQPCGGLMSCRIQDFEDPLGVHLPRKVRERILDGFYVDIFTLLKLDIKVAKKGTKKDKKGAAKWSMELNFNNWMAGYTVYMTLVGAVFPERAWHLMNHFNNVLKARAWLGALLL